jgi:circadian clock protein KaiC
MRSNPVRDDWTDPHTRLLTGISGFDNILAGGLPQGHIFLIEGEPGTGKTTLGLQFLLAGAERGEAGLYVTLSETRHELQIVAKSHQWSLDDISVFEFLPNEGSLDRDDQYTAFHPSEMEFQDTMETILKEIEKKNPRRLVLDSLADLRLLSRDSLRYRRQILALKRYFADRNCTVLLLDDRTSEGHDRQLQSVVHGVVLMERLSRDYGAERRRLRVSKLRATRFREGFHDYTIQTGGIEVYPRLIAAEYREQVPSQPISSGLPELDSLTGGGLCRGSSTLLTGPAGTGKSTISMGYAVASARRGEPALFYTFDETRNSAIERASNLGNDPRPYIQSGLLEIKQVDPAELSPGEFTHDIRRAVDDRKVRLIVIDSLNGLLNAMPGEDYLAIQMHELVMFLNQRGIVTLLVLSQSGILGAAMHSPVDLSYLADNMLLFRYFEAAGKVRKAISVVKNRTTAHEDTIRELRLRNGGIEVGEPLTDFQGVMSGIPTFIGVAGQFVVNDDPRR